MGINILPATSSAPLSGVGSVVASGSVTKGFTQISLAAGNYVVQVYTASTWGWNSPNNKQWGRWIQSGQPTYITLTSSDTVFTMGSAYTEAGFAADTGTSGALIGTATVAGTSYLSSYQSTNSFARLQTNMGNLAAGTTVTTGQYTTGTGGATALYANGVYFMSSGTTMWRSTNCVTWTTLATITGGAAYRQMVFGSSNNYYCAVGMGATASNSIASSTDGVTWTTRNSVTSTNTMYSIAYGNAAYVAVGQAGQIVSSTDSITWASRTSGTTRSLYNVLHNGTVFLAMANAAATANGSNNPNAWVSTDGTTWTATTVGLSSTSTWGLPSNLFLVTTLGSTFVLAGQQSDLDEDTIYYSTNGTTWGGVPRQLYASYGSYFYSTYNSLVNTTAPPNQPSFFYNIGNVLYMSALYPANTTQYQSWVPTPFSYTIYASTN